MELKQDPCTSQSLYEILRFSFEMLVIVSQGTCRPSPLTSGSNLGLKFDFRKILYKMLSEDMRKLTYIHMRIYVLLLLELFKG